MAKDELELIEYYHGIATVYVFIRSSSSLMSQLDEDTYTIPITLSSFTNTYPTLPP